MDVHVQIRHSLLSNLRFLLLSKGFRIADPDQFMDLWLQYPQNNPDIIPILFNQFNCLSADKDEQDIPWRIGNVFVTFLSMTSKGVAHVRMHLCWQS